MKRYEAKSKILDAGEVTEPGYYRVRDPSGKWSIGHFPLHGLPILREKLANYQFQGPINPEPEV